MLFTLIIKLITWMFLHRETTVTVLYNYLSQITVDGFPRVISKCLIPFVVFLQLCVREQSMQKRKKKGILGGLLQLCISKINEVSLCPPSAHSVGWASDYCAEGCGFKPQLDQHSGSLNNWGESVAFVMTFANG